MPVGSPDYGVILTQINETQISDTSELAARLGSMVAINRTGQVVYEVSDALLYANNYYTSSDGLANFVASWIYGNFNRPALKLVTSTTNAAYAGAYPQFEPLGSLQVGMQTWMTCTSFNCSVQLQLVSVVSGVKYQAGIQVNLSTGVVSYWGNDAAWHSIGTFKVPTAVGQVLVVKFTVDFAANKYKKLYLGNEVWADISSYSPQIGVSAIQDESVLYLQITNLTAASNSIYIAGSVVTINEV